MRNHCFRPEIDPRTPQNGLSSKSGAEFTQNQTRKPILRSFRGIAWVHKCSRESVLPGPDRSTLLASRAFWTRALTASWRRSRVRPTALCGTAAYTASLSLPRAVEWAKLPVTSSLACKSILGSTCDKSNFVDEGRSRRPSGFLKHNQVCFGLRSFFASAVDRHRKLAFPRQC